MLNCEHTIGNDIFVLFPMPNDKNTHNTTYTFFKELDYYPIKSIWIVCNEINNLIDTYYNILS